MPPKTAFIARGQQRYKVIRTKTFNIDNGAGTPDDDPVLYSVNGLYIIDAYIVYSEATDTAGAASANVKIGTTAGGAQIVAQTALGVSKAVGAATALTLVSGGDYVPAGSTVFVRHTGVATTEVGQYAVQIRYMPKP